LVKAAVEHKQPGKSIAHGFNRGWEVGLRKPEAQGGFGEKDVVAAGMQYVQKIADSKRH
jgi:hypothetical protein